MCQTVTYWNHSWSTSPFLTYATCTILMDHNSPEIIEKIGTDPRDPRDPRVFATFLKTQVKNWHTCLHRYPEPFHRSVIKSHGSYGSRGSVSTFLNDLGIFHWSMSVVYVAFERDHRGSFWHAYCFGTVIAAVRWQLSIPTWNRVSWLRKLYSRCPFLNLHSINLISLDRLMCPWVR